jgi:hypothetical protein
MYYDLILRFHFNQNLRGPSLRMISCIVMETKITCRIIDVLRLLFRLLHIKPKLEGLPRQLALTPNQIRKAVKCLSFLAGQNKNFARK